MTNDEFAKLSATPAGYAYIKLGMEISPKQKQILNSFFVSKQSTRLSCCLCNSGGKTSVVAVAIALYSLEVLNAKVLYTSATWKQVHTQFLSSIKKYSHLFPPSWNFLDTGITINGIPRLICISTDQEANYQGHHSTPEMPLVIITDESAGLNESIFRAVDRCSPSSLVVMGSPLGTDNYFYKIECDPLVASLFQHFKVTQLECPWIPREQIELMIRKWGKEHPLVLSSVYAEFSQDSDNSIVSLSGWNKCINNPPEYIPNDRRVALDFAAGNDSNCVVYRNGNRIDVVKVWAEKDTMTAAGEIKIELEKLRKTVGIRPDEVVGDASGLGKPILDRLAELGWKCHYFFGQEKPKDENYKNSITECWLELAKKIVNCSIILPNNEDLRGQLIGRKRRLNSSGKLELESKEEMKSRMMSSPDIADAAAMTLYEPSTGVTTTTYVPRRREKTYSMF